MSELPQQNGSRIGRGDGPAGVEIGLRESLEIVSLAARRGADAALADGFADRLGLALPAGPCRTGREGVCVLGVGPRRWLLVNEGPELEPRLVQEMAGLATVVLQSDGYRVFRVEGPSARASLAKGLAIDLHSSAFGPDSVAVTQAAHMGVIVWRTNGESGFDLAVFRSHQVSFWYWLRDSAVEFGLQANGAVRSLFEPFPG